MIASPWYLEDLPYCFTKFGEAHRLPADACDVAGIPYILPIAYIPAIENPNAYKPLHAVKTGLAEFTCLICGETKKANNQISNNSNAFTHVRKKHLDHYPIDCWSLKDPINCWSLEEARELEVKWKKDLSERKRCLNAPRQITLQQAFAGTKSVPEQIKCLIIIKNALLDIMIIWRVIHRI